MYIYNMYIYIHIYIYVYNCIYICVYYINCVIVVGITAQPKMLFPFTSKEIKRK